MSSYFPISVQQHKTSKQKHKTNRTTTCKYHIGTVMKIPMSGVSSSPKLATCETSQVLFAGVPDGFSRGSSVFAHLLIGPYHMSCNILERDVKLNCKK